MLERKYQLEDVSPTRVFVRNKSFWRGIGRENIAKIVEDLNASGRIVTAIIPCRNFWNDYDYLIITLTMRQVQKLC